MTVLNMLTWWQWVVLAAVPPAIVVLYFLKLKRRPVEVPSTYLWLRSIEDLHVNTIWQRLRRNLLLMLQLLLILLAVLALLRPGWRGTHLTGNRFIFLIDNSASMRATDVKPTRLDEAKRQARQLIDAMTSGDVAMIVSFADTARVEQMFTDSRSHLREALDNIEPTDRPTSLLEALKVAAGLANPGRTGEDASRDVLVAEAMPAKVLIFSDGKFPSVTGFSLGNLDPEYMPIGDPGAVNVGITAFSIRRNEAHPEQLQAFARLENFGTRPVSVSLELRSGNQLLDADKVQLDPEQARGVAFDLGTIEQGVLKLSARTDDVLAADDTAWAVINAPRHARVLLVTPGVEPLELALATQAARELADVTVQGPEFLTTNVYRQQAATGQYDLIIYDRCRPEQMPQANTFWIGAVPPVDGWKADQRVNLPQILDTDPSHPIMQWLNLDRVVIADGTPLELPLGGTVLIDSHVGPLFAIASRGTFEDAVLGFVFIGQQAGKDKKPEQYVGTNWPIRASFPLFVLNVLHYLGGGRTTIGGENVRPGQPVVMECPARNKKVDVLTPTGQTVRVEPTSQDKINFAATDQLGVYELRAGGKPVRQFAVNLFQPLESNIPPIPEIQIGHVEIAGQSNWEVTRREIWKTLLILGLVVLCVEWYTYNRRVAW